MGEMKIADFDIRSFRIPFRESVTVAGKRLQHREGFILSLTDEQHNRVFGEVAPLPGLDRFSLSQCRDTLVDIKLSLLGHTLQPQQFDLKKPLLGLVPIPAGSRLDTLNACVRFGLESALLQLYLLHAPQRLPESGRYLQIPVSGLFIPSHNSERLESQLDALRQSGFDTVKVKIGRIGLQQEVEQIIQLADTFDGAVSLRLDGNRCLNLADYRQYYHHLGSLPVEYVEEPLPSVNLMDALTVPWPIALDESLSDYLDDRAPDLERLPGKIRHIIVKPAAMQGIYGLFRLLATSADNGIQAVLSSAFNTGLGLLSLGLVSHLSAKGFETAHGLDTLKYLSGDLLAEPLSIRKGKLRLPVSLFTGEIELNPGFIKETIPC